VDTSISINDAAPQGWLHVLTVTLPKTPEAQKSEKKIAIKKA
jgi:hypothetical protein